mgnify:CR=1 FL=1
MPNTGVKLESAARQRVVSTKLAVDVLNIMAFVEIFYLQYISFDLEYGEMMAWFRPKDDLSGGAFAVDRRVFSELNEVMYTTDPEVVFSNGGGAVYTGKGMFVRIEIPNEGFFLSSVGSSFQYKGEDLTGSVCFAVKMDPKKFPKQSNCCNGILTFRLKNGQEYKFQCEQQLEHAQPLG